MGANATAPKPIVPDIEKLLSELPEHPTSIDPGLRVKALSSVQSNLDRLFAEDNLYPAQRDVMTDLINFYARHDKGYINLPTGSGKTVLFSELALASNLRTLIVVPTKKILEQTLEAFAGRGVDNVRVASITSPEKENKQFTVATYASFVSNYRSGYGKYVIDPELYELVVFDEAHHVQADGALRASREFKQSYQIGFTATPDYSEERFLKQTLPSAIHELTINQAIELGLITQYANVMLATGADLSAVPRNKSDYDAAKLDKAINTPTRNADIAKFYTDSLADKKAIFSCGSVEHSYAMATALKEQGIKAEAMHGGMQKTERQQIFDDFQSGKVMALCNNKLLTEGFDEPSIEVVINVTPTLSRVRQQQRSGRALRLDPNNPSKEALIIDCIDSGYKYKPVLFMDESIANGNGLQQISLPTSKLISQLAEIASDNSRLLISQSDIKTRLESKAKPQSAYKPAAKQAGDRAGKNRAVSDNLLTGLWAEEPLLHPNDWTEYAYCNQQLQTDQFYPAKGGSTLIAKFMCSKCIVQDECLDDALQQGDTHGIWGGLSERERRKVGKLINAGDIDEARLTIETNRERGYAKAQGRYLRGGLVPVTSTD